MDSGQSLGRSEAEGRWGSHVAPRPLHALACTLLACREEGHVSNLRIPEMVGGEVPLPGWLLNTASKTPDIHVAHQWGDGKGRMWLQT